MSHHRPNFTHLQRQGGFRSYDGHTYNHHESNEVPVFYRSNSTQATDERTSDVLPRQRVWACIHPVGFHHIPYFPSAAPRRQQIIQNEHMGRLRDIFLQPPSRYTFQTSTQAAPAVEISKSTVLSKLEKVVYARKLNLYYRNNAEEKHLKEKKEKDEDGKRCAICLEDFKTGEEVMLTPCKHMFHEDCIVPWLTTKGQCPVCRRVICEMGCGNPSSFSNNNWTTLESSNLFNGELLSVFRDMEEAFQFGI
ncbi:E3 ubiquitin-protein ligase RNF165-like [Vigna umbellata]|uniref:E3 ubiquitin-protein ligase RNF165-like n=1 Tax=Vigna umbellata TaxID=87088 RepID=UPI001F5EC714|nr:E3 ubiquitin-protein ligase RNF165-like [Vigna umbellata]